MADDCIDCDNNGLCAWAGCTADADYRVNDVVVIRQGLRLDVGDVELCGGHKRRAERLGRLELDWDRVYRAVEAQA